MYNVIHWTEIYPMDSVIGLLNYWGLQVIFSFTSLLKGALRELKLYCHYSGAHRGQPHNYTKY